MDPIGVFSGLASGIDYRELVDQIIAFERRPIDRLQAKIDRVNGRQSAFDQYRGLLDAFQTTAASLSDGTAFDAVLTTSSGNSSINTPLFSAVGGPGATPGVYQVEVLSLAATEKISGNEFSDPTTVLGLAGEFVVNNRSIGIDASDTLGSIRDKINAANSGPSATGVTATLLATVGGASRIILTADQSGEAGISLSDTSAGVLGQLGFVDGTTTISNPNSSGADTARFSDDTTAIASLLGLSSAGGPQTVVIGGQNVVIDLDTETLTDIAANISLATGVSATVQNNVLADGSTEYYIDIRGTTSFVDSGNTLEIMGVLEQGRSATAQVLTGATMEVSGGGPALSTTLLQDIYQGGSAAGFAAGDTFTISGTRGDGSAVNFVYTPGGADQVGDLLAALNDNTTGFGAGVRPATATLDANGAIVLTDSAAGDSQVSLSIIANNENGGTFDLGTFASTTVGRAREITDGADSVLRVDGITLTRSTNTITDAITDVTMNLVTAEPGKIGTIAIARSTDEAAQVLQDFVDQYNDMLGFVKSQLIVSESQPRPALFGDSTLRSTRSTMVNIFLSQVQGAASDLSTLATMGIGLNSDGTLALDATKFIGAYNTRYNDVLQLFMEQGSATDPEVQFVSSTGTATGGTYAVDITTAATQAVTTGVGFSGIYADDGTSDSITLTDVLSSASATIQLTNGMTTQDIVDALNSELGANKNQQLTSSQALFSDAGATTPVTMASTFDSLFDSAGTAAGVVNGDTIDYSGFRADGTSFNGSFTVIDIATSSVGDLIGALQTQYGAEASVSIVNGVIVVDAVKAGPTALSLSTVSNNEGGGTLDLGAMAVTVAGRNSMGLSASASGNQIVVSHTSFGSGPGFTVAYTGGGIDNTAQLGVAASTYNGIDVAGTLGGFAATGSGQQLVGNAGSPVSGLHISFTGSLARTAGNVDLTVGTGAALERMFDTLFEVGSGILDSRDTAYDDQISRLGINIDRAESRVARKEAFLLKKFAAMEVVIGQLQAQGSSLSSQIQSLLSPTGARQ